jgi:hypothetical protein
MSLRSLPNKDKLFTTILFVCTSLERLETCDLRQNTGAQKPFSNPAPLSLTLCPGPFTSCLMPRAFLTSLPGLVKNLTIFIRPQDALVAISGAKY